MRSIYSESFYSLIKLRVNLAAWRPSGDRKKKSKELNGTETK
jgi:hypothetical protein